MTWLNRALVISCSSPASWRSRPCNSFAAYAATKAYVLAFGEALAAAVVALMYAGGQYLEAFAERRARREMTSLLQRVPRTALRHRGGDLEEVPLEAVAPAAEERAELLAALDEALDNLRKLDERQARAVECRFFGGMTEEETAEALGIAVRTARRDGLKAKSWLYGDLFPG